MSWRSRCPRSASSSPARPPGFLYQTDSNIAWIENLVASPTLGREQRSESIDLIVQAVGGEARRLGFKV